MPIGRLVRSFVLVSFVLSCWTPLAVAQEAERVVKEPPLLTAIREKATTLIGPSGAAGEKALELNIVYTNGTLWNPATHTDDQVRLRSYQVRTSIRTRRSSRPGLKSYPATRSASL